jgi:hypothetical protein
LNSNNIFKLLQTKLHEVIISPYVLETTFNRSTNIMSNYSWMFTFEPIPPKVLYYFMLEIFVWVNFVTFIFNCCNVIKSLHSCIARIHATRIHFQWMCPSLKNLHNFMYCLIYPNNVLICLWGLIDCSWFIPTRRKRPICDQCIYNYLWLFDFYN